MFQCVACCQNEPTEDTEATNYGDPSLLETQPVLDAKEEMAEQPAEAQPEPAKPEEPEAAAADKTILTSPDPAEDQKPTEEAATEVQQKEAVVEKEDKAPESTKEEPPAASAAAPEAAAAPAAAPAADAAADAAVPDEGSVPLVAGGGAKLGLGWRLNNGLVSLETRFKKATRPREPSPAAAKPGLGWKINEKLASLERKSSKGGHH